MSPTTRSVIAACILTVACVSGQGQVVNPPPPSQVTSLSLEKYCAEFEAQSAVLQQRAPPQAKKEKPSAEQMAEGKDAIRSVVPARGEAANAQKSAASSPSGQEDGPDPDVMKAMCSMVKQLRSDTSPAHRVIRVRPR